MEFIYLVRFWIQNVGDIDFKVIFAAENSIKFPKNQVLEGKKSVENVVTLEGLPIQFKHDFLSYLAVKKNLYINCKTMFTY